MASTPSFFKTSSIASSSDSSRSLASSSFVSSCCCSSSLSSSNSSRSLKAVGQRQGHVAARREFQRLALGDLLLRRHGRVVVRGGVWRRRLAAAGGGWRAVRLSSGAAYWCGARRRGIGGALSAAVQRCSNMGQASPLRPRDVVFYARRRPRELAECDTSKRQAKIKLGGTREAAAAAELAFSHWLAPQRGCAGWSPRSGSAGAGERREHPANFKIAARTSEQRHG